MQYSLYNKAEDIIRSSKDRLWIPLVFSILVFLLLILFQPFEYRSYTFLKTLKDSLFSAFLVLLVTLFTRSIIPYLFRSILKKNVSLIRNTIIESSADIVCFLGLSFLVNLIFGGFKSISSLNWFLQSLKYILIFEVLFVPLAFFIRHYFSLYLPFTDNAGVLLLPKQDLESSSTPLKKEISFISTSEQKHLEILPLNLIMIKSWGNYIEIFYVKDDEIFSSLLRNTFDNAKKLVEDYSFLFQCHRSYLVNINRILEAKGNVRGYQLTIEGMPNKVPVSRSKVPFFTRIFYKNED